MNQLICAIYDPPDLQKKKLGETFHINSCSQVRGLRSRSHGRSPTPGRQKTSTLKPRGCQFLKPQQILLNWYPVIGKHLAAKLVRVGPAMLPKFCRGTFSVSTRFGRHMRNPRKKTKKTATYTVLWFCGFHSIPPPKKKTMSCLWRVLVFECGKTPSFSESPWEKKTQQTRWQSPTLTCETVEKTPYQLAWGELIQS